MRADIEKRLLALEDKRPAQEWQGVFVNHEGDQIPNHNLDSDFLICIGSLNPFPTMKGSSPFGDSDFLQKLSNALPD